ncbi:hypothetical protein Tco_1207098, partial [Tanacetum coccineum]
DINEIRAEKLARNANPLALVAATQQYPDTHYQALKPHKPYTPSSKLTPSTRSHALTNNRGKEIAKPITPPSESASEEDEDTSSNTKNKNMDTSPRSRNDSYTGQFGNHRTIIVDGARKTIGNQVMQHNGIQCFNYKEFGHFAKECRKPKRAKYYAYHKEKMMLCKQEEKGVPLSVEQGDWLNDTNEEMDEQELEAHYMYMAKIQEVLTANSGPTFDADRLE